MRCEILKVIHRIWKDANIVLHEASGAYLVEVVSSQIDSDNLSDHFQTFSAAFNNWNKGKPKKEIVIFHKVYLYNASGDQFRYDGTLHTVEAEWGSMGEMTTLSANDAYVGVAEVDAQTHLYGGPTTIRIVPLPTDEGHFNIVEGVDYRQIEFQGVNCRIKSLRKTKPDSDIWEVEVQGAF